MIRAPFDHFGYVFGLLVHGHGSDDRPGRRRRGQLNLDWTRLRNLTVEFLQQRGILGIGNQMNELIKIKLPRIKPGTGGRKMGQNKRLT